MIAFVKVLTSGSLLADAAATSVMPFLEYIQPFLPAFYLMIVAALIEGGLRWRELTPRANWWFGLGAITTDIFLLIWNSWSQSFPIAASVDMPGQEGLKLRLLLISFGLIVILSIAGMALGGIRSAVKDNITVRTGITILRCLPAFPLLILLVWNVHLALKVFEGVKFQLFI